MPALEEEPIADITSPDSSILLVPTSSTSSDFSISQDSEGDQSSYLIPCRIEIPQQPTLRELVISATGTTDLATINQLKLQVIAVDACLQHLSFHTPNLSELTLDGSVITSLRDLGCDLKHLTILRVARCGLTSLDGVFGLEHLHELYAGDNKIEDLSPCAFLPKIAVVNLANNLLRDITLVSFLIICSKLKHIILEGNEKITSVSNYRKVVKEYLPNLESLDHVEFFLQDEAESKVATERLLAEDCNKNDQACNNGNRFLPAISGSSRPASYSVSFPPKILSPRPLTGSSSNTICTSAKGIFPDIKKRNSDEDQL